jgi:hypothetical protein
MLRITQLAGFAAGQAGPFLPDNSATFVDATNHQMNRNFAVTATDEEKWTWASWLKRTSAGDAQYLLMSRLDDNNDSGILFPSTGYFAVYGFFSAAYTARVSAFSNAGTTAEWHHWMCVYDSAQGTASNRVKLYRDGVLATSGFEFSTYPSGAGKSHLNNDTYRNHMQFGDKNATDSEDYNGLAAETYFVDGYALTPDQFIVSASGTTYARRYSGPFGANGYYNEYRDGSALGADSSPQGNDWSFLGTAPTQSTDTPP